MRGGLLFVLGMLVLPAGPVLATDKAPTAKRICRTTPAINSRLAGRSLCMTAREWELEDYSRIHHGAMRVEQHITREVFPGFQKPVSPGL